jgi:hypothetical protein
VRADTAGEARSKFPAERWAELRRSIESSPGEHATLGAPIFGCHEGEPGTGADLLCAGWAAAFESVSLRIAVSMGLLPISVLDAGQNWPELHADWDEMVAAHLLLPGDPDDHLPLNMRSLCERANDRSSS